MNIGKTKENLRKRVQVELITDAGILRKQVAKPDFCRGNPITECLTAIQCTVATLTLNRPIYAGFYVLDLSKLHMYNFHYNHMRVKYQRPNQLRLLFTDTDSLAYAVQTEDIYIDVAGDAALTTISVSTPSTIPSIVLRNVRQSDSSRRN